MKRFSTALLLLLVLTLSSAGSAAARLVPAGEAFQIGSENEMGFSPVVVARPDGAYLVVALFGDGISPRLQGRFYGPGGSPISDFFVIDTGSIAWPDVAFRPDGSFVVTYSKAGEIRGVLLYPNGVPQTLFLVAPQRQPNLVNEEPSVAVAHDGSWMIAWQEKVATDQDQKTVYGLWFAPDATPKTAPVTLTSSLLTLQSLPEVAATPDGGFFVLWVEDSNNPALPVIPYNLVGRRFDNAGSPLGPDRYLLLASRRGRIVLRPDNQGFVVVAETVSGGIELIRIGTDGQVTAPASSAPMPERLWDARGTLDASGRLLVTGTDDFGRLQARLLHVDTFRPLSDVFEIEDPLPTEVDFASARAGQFFMVWQYSVQVTWPIPEQLFGQLLTLDCDIPGSAAPGLCLQNSRFQVEVSWRDHQGNTGVGHPVPLGEDTGTFWFFSESNVELLVKILDGRNVNDHFWVFYGSLSDVQYEIRIHDTLTGSTRTYANPAGHIASHADVEAFPADSPVSPTIAAASARSPRSLAAPHTPPTFCESNDTTLCLLDPEYSVTVEFVDPQTGQTRQAQALPFSRESGAFWFFTPGNIELFVKVLDGSALNGRAWVFHGALTDVEYTITVRHNAYANQVWTYHNPRGRMHSGADTSALPPPLGF